MKESVPTESSPGASWQEAKVFAAVSVRDMASGTSNILGELILWSKSVDLYHHAEMGGAPTVEERQMQKPILSALISMGEWLVTELRQRGVNEMAGVTSADVAATLEELYVSQRMLFGGITEARRAQVLDEVFGAS
jgi:hypothetical protein